MSNLADRIRDEAAEAARPGQMERLEALADEVEKRLLAERRELWWLESFLAVNGTTPGHHERRLRLYRHLCATCEHDWGDVSGWGGCAQGTTQCRWCNAVAQPGEKRPALGPLPSINEVWPRADMHATPKPLPPLEDRDPGAVAAREAIAATEETA